MHATGSNLVNTNETFVEALKAHNLMRRNPFDVKYFVDLQECERCVCTIACRCRGINDMDYGAMCNG